jgi:hypothetical protein
MEEPDDLVLSMFAVVVAAVMLVAGELYLVSEPQEAYAPAPPAVTSSIH